MGCQGVYFASYALSPQARAEINLDKGCSLIHICARFKNHEAMQLLFAANAAVSTQAIPHFPAPGPKKFFWVQEEYGS